jgi:glucose/arabinose dehydrogenase
VLFVLACLSFTSFAQGSVDKVIEPEDTPSIKDPDLKIITVVEGLKRPTSMAFLGPDDFLVLEKNSGIVKRIVNGSILTSPVLDVAVANEKERGLLGVAIQSNNSDLNDDSHNSSKEGNNTSVFLYFTESSGLDGNDDCPLINYCMEGADPKGNRLYGYELIENKLVNPKLLLDLPAQPGADHIGGAIVIGPDKNIYLMSGDGHSCSYGSCDNGTKKTVLNSQSANVRDGQKFNGRGGILRVTQDGLTVNDNGKKGILNDDDDINKYFAYGIRNGFGIDFDPITKKLWDTENGPSFGDEINLVEPGFNSGWSKIQGIWPITNYTMLLPQGLFPPYKGYLEIYKQTQSDSTSPDEGELLDFGGIGEYSDPEFIWNITVGVTALKFLDSDKLGKIYENDMFVGDYSLGRIYHFDLNSDRTRLDLNGSLANKIAPTLEGKDIGQIIFGEGFDAVTDLEVGPDGYLYVVSHKGGKIYKIVPSTDTNY